MYVEEVFASEMSRAEERMEDGGYCHQEVAAIGAEKGREV